MTVIVVEAVPDAVRGMLSRWMIEPVAGVFVGPLPARARESVWKMVASSADTGRSCLISTASNEQGFRIETVGESLRILVDYDGVELVALTE